MTTPRIYVASLSDYNAGRLHGAWIDAAQEPDCLADDISAMLANSPTPHAEEWAIHDYDECPDLGEHPSLDLVSAVGMGIEEHGATFAAWLSIADIDHSDPSGLEDAFTDAYQGTFESTREFAEDWIDNGLMGDVPDAIAPYINYDAVACDLMCDYTTVRNADGLHVFL